jgi:hypothetical protein
MQNHRADLDLDQLQLAMDCLSHGTAAFPSLGCHLDPATAQRLLLTAFVRRHASLWVSLLELPQVQQHVDAATFEAAIELALIHEGFDVENFMWRIHEQPAAALLDADAVARLLQAAMKLSRFGAPPTAPEQLMAYAAASKHAELLRAALPQALQQRTAAHSTTQHQSYNGWDDPFRQLQSCLEELCQVPGAAGISSNDVYRLQLEALQLQGSGPDACVPALCRLRGMACTSSHQLTRLEPATWKAKQKAAHSAIWNLPAFEQLQRAQIAQQLLDAAEAGDLTGIYMVKRPMEIWQLGSAAVLPALEAAVKRDTQCFAELLNWPAAKHLSSEEVTQLLQAAVLCGSFENLDALCKLHAAQQLISTAVEQLLLAALQQCKAAAVRRLCRLPAAQQLGDKLRQLLQVAEQLESDECTHMLRSLSVQQ